MLPEPLTGLNQGLPEDFWILLCPRWLLRIIRNKGNSFFGQQLSCFVKDYGFETLGTIVDCQDQISGRPHIKTTVFF
jgi:hypothetical protein